MCAKAEDGTHTLMKGDEVVESVQVFADFHLFVPIGYRNHGIPYELFVQVIYRASGGKHSVLVKHLGCTQHMAKKYRVELVLSVSDQ